MFCLFYLFLQSSYLVNLPICGHHTLVNWHTVVTPNFAIQMMLPFFGNTKTIIKHTSAFLKYRNLKNLWTLPWPFFIVAKLEPFVRCSYWRCENWCSQFFS
jgi:hypothetical protein